jgi:hypothetical protein
MDIKPSQISDQSKFSRGIRETANPGKEDGKYIEAEIAATPRRDPEESCYNEASQPVVTEVEVEDKS